MKKLKIAFFGSPDFSADFLEKLSTDTLIKHLIKVKLVITQPDKPVGRKQILTPTPVKMVAQKNGLEILEIKNCLPAGKAGKLIRNLKLEIKNFDICLVYAYASIIPKELLDLPKYGFFNIHPSLLPQYRGPSPISYSLILGDKQTGVTIIKMDEKIDHGPIIAQEKLTISQTDKRPDLEVKLTNLAFKMFKEIIGRHVTSLKRPLSRCNFDLQPQNHQKATFTRLLTKNDGYIPLSTLTKSLNNKPLTFEELPKIIQEYLNKYQYLNKYPSLIENGAKIIYNLFRGLYPWPGIWTTVNIKEKQKRLKLTDMKLLNFKNFSALKLDKVQLEGKKEVDFKTFNKAYKIF